MAELWDSNIVLACYHLKTPDITAIPRYESDKFRLYMADTGLLVTMLFDKSVGSQPDIYNKLSSIYNANPNLKESWMNTRKVLAQNMTQT